MPKKKSVTEEKINHQHSKLPTELNAHIKKQTELTHNRLLPIQIPDIIRYESKTEKDDTVYWVHYKVRGKTYKSKLGDLLYQIQLSTPAPSISLTEENKERLEDIKRLYNAFMSVKINGTILQHLKLTFDQKQAPLLSFVSDDHKNERFTCTIGIFMAMFQLPSRGNAAYQSRWLKRDRCVKISDLLSEPNENISTQQYSPLTI